MCSDVSTESVWHLMRLLPRGPFDSMSVAWDRTRVRRTLLRRLRRAPIAPHFAEHLAASYVASWNARRGPPRTLAEAAALPPNELLASLVARRVRRSSFAQAFSGFFSAGPLRSARYAYEKFSKGLFARSPS